MELPASGRPPPVVPFPTLTQQDLALLRSSLLQPLATHAEVPTQAWVSQKKPSCKAAMTKRTTSLEVGELKCDSHVGSSHKRVVGFEAQLEESPLHVPQPLP